MLKLNKLHSFPCVKKRHIDNTTIKMDCKVKGKDFLKKGGEGGTERILLWEQ